LRPENYKAMGVHIGMMGLPTVVVQEGGYSVNEMLGSCAASLISGIIEGAN
jgi:acetoin utilization deacetylase AcuC-like enzyme